MAGVIETLVMPPVGNLVLAGVGLLLLRTRRVLGRLCVLAGLGSLLLLSLPVVSAALLISHQVDDALPPKGVLPDVDAIVVLSADFKPVAPEMGGATVAPLTLERVRYGAMLARRSGVPVLLTGGSLGPKEPPVARLMGQLMEKEFGVGVRWEESRATSTRENALFSAKILSAEGCHRVLLVTHAWHMPRARRAFEQAGLEVIAAPTAFHPWPARDLGAITPHSRALVESHWALHEWLGRLWYRLTE